MSETRTRTLTLHGTPVEYEVRYSAEATKARIDVGLKGIRVVIPERSPTDSEALVAENADWVLEKKRKYDDYRARIPDRTFAAGETFPYRDEPHEIVVETRSKSDIEDGQFRLADHHVKQTSIKRALETLYRRRAREFFEEQAERFADRMGVEYAAIEVRNQRTKWGSCSTTGTLSLNWRLLMAPPAVATYVVVHEVAHLREPNHTDAFWSLVAEYDPEYRDHTRWLKDHGARLVFSDDDI